MTEIDFTRGGERTPSSLCAADFATYQANARLFAFTQLPVLRTLPVILCVLMLKQIARYDSLFPAEREDLSQLLLMISSEEFLPTLSAFNRISISAELRGHDWIVKPALFVETMTNELWSSDQIDEFRHAAAQLAPPIKEERPGSMARLVIVDLDSRLEKTDFMMFRRLFQHGMLFTNLTPDPADDPFTASLRLLESRARTLTNTYSHWVICGDTPPRTSSLQISTLDYKSLEPVRHALLNLMSAATKSGTNGPEALRSAMMGLEPKSLGVAPSDALNADPLLAQFCIDLLGQGSGTQTYSTSFVQWAAREVLLRARPITAIIRFTPRVQQRPTNQQWSKADAQPEFDLPGSLVDADMAAYYTWINLNRMPCSTSSSFVVFHSGRRQAFAIGRGMAEGTCTDQAISPSKLLSFVS